MELIKMTWHIEFVAPSKRAAIKALMHPQVERSRGLPIAIREQVITLVESLSENDGAAFISVKTHGSIGAMSAHANVTIEVNLVPSYILPVSDPGPEQSEAGALHHEAGR
jgi:hypothetical protein